MTTNSPRKGDSFLFFLSKHFVIALYILEIAVATAVFAMSKLLKKQNPKHGTMVLLGTVMAARLIIKLIYFYVEFYIAGWPLDIIINFAMDCTYVLSMLLCVRLFAECVGFYSRGLTALMRVSSLLYVFLWMFIQIFFVDPASNHIILFTNYTAEIIYTLNESLFCLAFLHVFVIYALRLRKKDKAFLALCIASALYVVYVFLWDVSFVFSSLEFVRHIKPMDGVLVFSLAYFLIFFINEKEAIANLFNTEKLPVKVVLNTQIEPLAFANAKGLTAREKEVFALLVQGHSNSDIAQRLFISDNTVKRHLTSVYKKCEAKGRTQLLYNISEWNDNSK